MTTPSEQLSTLASLTSEVEYDLVEYDQAKIDALANAAKAMAARVEDIFGVNHYQLTELIRNAHMVADTDAGIWAASMR
jgi:hypothetical protein